MNQLARRDVLKLASLAALAPFGAVSCGPKCPPQIASGEWSNAIGSLRITPGMLYLPSGAREIIAMVQAAESMNERVRMTGSGHSFSDVALSDDFMFLPTKLNKPLPLQLDKSRLKPAFANDTLVRVPSGATIGEINSALDPMDLALANMGGYDGQTIVGAAMTATHGSGLEYGPITSQIVSFQVVASGGAMFQIEPSNGITRRAEEFPNGLKCEEDPSITLQLVQNDDWFHALGVSMGCMGIVTSVVIRAVKKFWLRETRKTSRWKILAEPNGYVDRLISGAKLNENGSEPEHVEIYVNPYATEKHGISDHTCLVTERYRLPAPPAPTPGNQKRGRFGEGAFFAMPDIQRLAETHLVKFLDKQPKPWVHGLLDGMLFALSDPDDYCAVSYRIFNVGDINRFRMLGIEMAFPIEQTVAATEAMFQIATEQETTKNRRNSVPVTLRFTAQADFFLAMQHGRKTMMMEIGALLHSRESRELLKTYEERFMAKFPQARPHWGLDLSVLQGEAQVAARYPSWNRWKTVYGALNKSGVFKGRLTERLGI